MSEAENQNYVYNNVMQNKTVILGILTILILTIITMGIFALFGKKCVTYLDQNGNKSGGCFYIWQKGYWSGTGLLSYPRNNNATNTKTFSEIPGFSFEYPVIKGWELADPKEVIKDSYDIPLKNTVVGTKADQVNQPKIIVEKKAYSEKDFEIPAEAVSYPNPNKVPYIYTKEELSGGDYAPSHFAYVGFYGSDYKVWVQLDNLSEKSGFPADQFMKKVIETFKFDSSSRQIVTSQTEYEKTSLQDIESQKEKLPNVDQDYALQIAKTDAVAVLGDLSLYNVAASLKADGWNINYGLKVPRPGGGAHYLIDSRTGKIISKQYYK